MDRPGKRPMPPRRLAVLALAAAVALAMIGLALLARGNARDGQLSAAASGSTAPGPPSSVGPPSAPSPPAPSVLTSPPPPPVPTPDAAQSALVAQGWTFLPLTEAGLSIVLPPGWIPTAPDAPAATTQAFAAVGRDYPAYKPFTDAAMATVESGGWDLAAVDGAPAALASGGGAVLDGARWATSAASADLIASMKTSVPETTDQGSFVVDARDLPSGHADRLTFRYPSPRTSNPALGIWWAVHTPRGVVQLQFRGDVAQAADLDRLAETVAGSIRPLAGRRADVVPHWSGLSPIAIVIDASDRVTPEWLAAEQQAVIDFLADLTWSQPIAVVASGGPAPRVIVPVQTLYGRGPIDAAIRGVTRGGAPNTKAAIDAAYAELTAQKSAGRQVIVLAASDVAFDGAAIAKSVDIHTDEALRGIALGRGPQEAQAFDLAGGTYSYNGYALAETPADIGHALALVRRTWDLAIVPIGLGRSVPGEATSVLVPAALSDLRFTIEQPSWIVVPVLVDPSGRRFGLDTPQPSASVVEGEGRTTITVPAPAAGEWHLELGPGVGPVPEEVAWFAEAFGTGPTSVTANWPRAETQYGSGGPMEVAVGISELGAEAESDRWRAVTATITVDDPADVTHSRLMDRSGTQDLGISTDLVKGVTIYATRVAGSYHLRFAIDGTDASGAPFHLEPETWHYVPKSLDTDGDGTGDDYEKAFGGNPSDPTDNRTDDDGDGLPLDREVYELWTDPFTFDTDGGREGDGSEVAAGRDPTNPADDVPVEGCLENVKPTPPPVGAPTPAPSAPRDPALEALLPDDILDRPTTKFSIAGHPENDTYLGPIFRVLAECVGATAADESTAYAIAPDLRNWGVIAINVRGHTGAELLDTFLHRLRPGSEDSLQARDAVVDGRHYLRSENSWALYAAGPTLYWVVSFNIGDFPPSSLPPIPPLDDIIRDVIRSLPGA